jgi:AcrR family transcriptional regulator
LYGEYKVSSKKGSVMRRVPESIAQRVDAAAGTFAEKGLVATRMEDVAEATGVPRATLYYYFKGKDAVFGFVLTRILERGREAIVAALATPGTGADRLRAVIRAQLGSMADEPAACQTLIMNLGQARQAPELAKAVEDAFYSPLRALLVEGQRDGSLRTVRSPETALSALFGAVTIAGLHHLMADGHPSLDKVAADLCDLLLGGLGGSRAPTTSRRTRKGATS